MASAKLYLRPIGLLYGATAAEAVAEGLALPLAGGPIAFTAAELIEGVPGNTRMRLFTAHALVSSGEADLASLLARITAKRPPFAGVALDRPVLMGIVNVTPNSFSDGGLFDTKEAAIVHAAELATAGAGIIDVGGESTRPGSDAVGETEELDRVVPVIAGLAGLPAIISIDTRKASVARAAAKQGAKILNDVSALTHDPHSLRAAAETGLAVVLMHAQGEPKTMQDNPRYEDVVLEVFNYLEARIGVGVKAGIAPHPHRRRSGLRLRQDARPQSGAAGPYQPVPRPRRAAFDRRLPQTLHPGRVRRRSTAEPGARVPSRGGRGGGTRGTDFAGA